MLVPSLQHVTKRVISIRYINHTKYFCYSTCRCWTTIKLYWSVISHTCPWPLAMSWPVIRKIATQLEMKVQEAGGTVHNSVVLITKYCLKRWIPCLLEITIPRWKIWWVNKKINICHWWEIKTNFKRTS